ncbi:MAG: PEP-CTERM sorting domain-containing protein [Cyanobacteriota bacterium]|nr:PEP-CTERM sorting domain-containing protein [Cyanobacteriota bacterium]
MKNQILTAAATTAIVGLASVAPALAASFGTSGISFDEDTTVEFEVLQTYGAYMSDLKVYEVIDGQIAGDLGLLFGEVQAADVVDANGRPSSDPLGTAGNAVIGSPTYFTFEADKEYTLGVVNYGWWQNKETDAPRYQTVYSTSILNDNGTQRAVFDSTGGSELNGFDASMYTEGDVFGDWLNMSFDDGGNQSDLDYQDFTFRAKVKTPEPAVLLGLGVAVGGMFLTRRNKNKVS